MNQLLSGLEQAALFVLVLGIVVAFHEAGHFLTAKALGVKVEVFSLGFGTRLFGRKWGETEYRISLIPLGGYVLMGGDLGEDPPRPRDPRDFDAQPVASRLAIMAAGPIFSALLAVLIMWGAFLAGVEVPAYLQERPRVGAVVKGSPAEAAGLRIGDVVETAGGAPMATWEQFVELVMTSPNSRLDLGVLREGSRLTLPVDVRAAGKHRIGDIGALPCSVVVVHAVNGGSPAEAAGLRRGDVIADLAGEETCTGARLTGHVESSAGGPIRLGLLRDGQRVEVEVVPRKTPDGFRIGVQPVIASVVQRYGIAESLRRSLTYNVEKAELIFRVLGRLVTGKLSFRTMSGPLEMAAVTEETADMGLMPFVTLVALITLNLAIFNLIPIPILDGGRILLLLVEAVRGRDLERRTKEWILQAGLAMIVVLIIVVLVFDAIKKLEG